MCVNVNERPALPAIRPELVERDESGNPIWQDEEFLPASDVEQLAGQYVEFIDARRRLAEWWELHGDDPLPPPPENWAVRKSDGQRFRVSWHYTWQRTDPDPVEDEREDLEFIVNTADHYETDDGRFLPVDFDSVKDAHDLLANPLKAIRPKGIEPLKIGYYDFTVSDPGKSECYIEAAWEAWPTDRLRAFCVRQAIPRLREQCRAEQVDPVAEHERRLQEVAAEISYYDLAIADANANGWGIDDLLTRRNHEIETREFLLKLGPEKEPPTVIELPEQPQVVWMGVPAGITPPIGVALEQRFIHMRKSDLFEEGRARLEKWRAEQEQWEVEKRMQEQKEQEREDAETAAMQGDFSSDGGGEISNVSHDSGDYGLGDESAKGASAGDIRDAIHERFGGFPAVCGDDLFVPVKGGGTRRFKDADDLFAWFLNFGHKDWVRGRSFVTENQFFKHLKLFPVRKYAAIETSPHWPRLPDHFYACEIPPAGDGKLLDQLVSRFTPSTPEDRVLLTAAIATTVWGGMEGTRPLFIITAPSAGQGSGKTKLVEIIADLVGGLFPGVRLDDKPIEIARRIFSPNEHGTKRVILIDNVKTDRMSSETVEAFITSKVAGGRPCHGHEMQKKNLYTWFLTTNEQVAGRDISQRAVVIHLDKPQYTTTWLEETSRFVAENRQAILGDLAGLLMRQPVALPKPSRNGPWEGGVLAKIPGADRAQAVMLERQATMDADSQEAGELMEIIVERIGRYGYNEQCDQVFIPSAVLRDWYVEMTGEKQIATVTVSNRVRQFVSQKKMKFLKANPSNSSGRGFIFSPEFPASKLCKDLLRRIVEDKNSQTLELEARKERQKIDIQRAAEARDDRSYRRDDDRDDRNAF